MPHVKSPQQRANIVAEYKQLLAKRVNPDKAAALVSEKHGISKGTVTNYSKEVESRPPEVSYWDEPPEQRSKAELYEALRELDENAEVFQAQALKGERSYILDEIAAIEEKEAALEAQLKALRGDPPPPREPQKPEAAGPIESAQPKEPEKPEEPADPPVVQAKPKRRSS